MSDKAVDRMAQMLLILATVVVLAVVINTAPA